MTSDKHLIRRRFEASFERYDALAEVQRRICGELAGAVERYVSGSPGRALEIGAGTGFLTRRLTRLYPDTVWTLNDLASAIGRYTDACIMPGRDGYLFGDAEEIDLGGPYDLIVTASTVQWFDDLPGFLSRASTALRPDGYLALTTFGPQNFHEIRAVTGEGLSYYTPEILRGMLLDAGFTPLWERSYCEKMWFDTPVAVLRHIKATGVNSLHNEQWTRGRLAGFDRKYRSAFADPHQQNRVSLTYHPILAIAKKMDLSRPLLLK